MPTQAIVDAGGKLYDSLAGYKLKLHKKWSFPLSISSVNVTKSAVFCGFGYIYWKNPLWKTSFFVQCKKDWHEEKFVPPLFTGILNLTHFRSMFHFYTLWRC